MLIFELFRSRAIQVRSGLLFELDFKIDYIQVQLDLVLWLWVTDQSGDKKIKKSKKESIKIKNKNKFKSFDLKIILNQMI